MSHQTRWSGTHNNVTRAPLLPLTNREGLPLWFSIDSINAPDTLSEIVESLCAAARSIVLCGGKETQANVEYVMARESASGRLRIKGKLSILNTGAGLEPGTPVRIQRALNRAWIQQLADTKSVVLNASIALHENELGHWSSASTPRLLKGS